MSPQWTSTLGIVFVVLAGVQVWLMLEVVGREKSKFSARFLSIMHRVNGYLFLAMYVFFLYVMIQKVAATNSPLDTKSLIHMILAVAILPMLLVKILIVRFYPKLFDTVVPLIGIGIFVLTFCFVFITGGYYFIKSATTKYVSTFDPQSSYLDIDVGRRLVIQKCNKCHDLTRVFTMVKSPEDWKGTVNRMVQRDPTWIAANQIDQIVYFLSERQNINHTEQILTVQIETLLDTKCSRCHNVERVFAQRRTRQEWRTLVTRMSNRHRSWISDTEANVIGDYLARIYGIKKETQIKLAALVKLPVRREINFAPLFEKLGCVFCHGEEGYGEAADTPDWTEPEWQDEKSDDDLFKSIAEGVGTQMPSFENKLSKDEIKAAVKFVRSFKGRE